MKLFLEESKRVMKKNPFIHATDYYRKTKSMWAFIVFLFKTNPQQDTKDENKRRLVYHHVPKIPKDLEYLTLSVSKLAFKPFLLK